MKHTMCFITLFVVIIAVYKTNAVLGTPTHFEDKKSHFKSAISAKMGHLLPTNSDSNDSIQYLLYTPENPKKVCNFVPDDSNECVLEKNYEFKILIHGYYVKLLPGNFFEQIKDTLLEYNKYYVIIVNWTKYNEPYITAVLKSYLVADNIGKMGNFLVKKGVSPSDIHIIGHSLGAHVAGIAGKLIPNLGRITGLDPAGPLFSKLIRFNRITYNSAKFVDVIHTSNYKTVDILFRIAWTDFDEILYVYSEGVGKGLGDAIGSIDFYPNGGNEQPACQIGKQYRNADAEVITITNQDDLASCHHNIVLPYFMNSIYLCNYLSVECESYDEYSGGSCNENSNPTNRMGLFCVDIPGLPKESKFYLNTTTIPPYCETEWQKLD